jgi:hypothetical protein
MRKGRANRKSRKRSLPPKPASQANQLGAEPQVVVGVTLREAPESLDGPAAPAAPEVRETLARDVSRSEAKARSGELPAPLEAVVEKALAIVAETSPTAEPEPTKTEEPSSLQAVVTPVAAKSAQDDGGSSGADDASSEVPRVASADEISIPPAGDIAIDEKFFSEGDLSSHAHADAASGHLDDWDDHHHKSARKHHPHVVQRRERFARYVTWAVAGASVLCLAALGRSAISAMHHTEVAPVAAAVAKDSVAIAAPELPAAAAQPAVAQPAQPTAAQPAAEPVQPPTEPAQPTAAQPTAAQPAEPAAAPAPAPTEAVDAKAEKAAARKALERGKDAEAIAAGERSVAADPEDGEAWLILGAAYQDKGKMADARRCYTACLKQGKRGPKSECAAMLR